MREWEVKSCWWIFYLRMFWGLVTSWLPLFLRTGLLLHSCHAHRWPHCWKRLSQTFVIPAKTHGESSGGYCSFVFFFLYYSCFFVFVFLAVFVCLLLNCVLPDNIINIIQLSLGNLTFSSENWSFPLLIKSHWLGPDILLLDFPESNAFNWPLNGLLEHNQFLGWGVVSR